MLIDEVLELIDMLDDVHLQIEPLDDDELLVLQSEVADLEVLYIELNEIIDEMGTVVIRIFIDDDEVELEVFDVMDDILLFDGLDEIDEYEYNLV